MSQNNPVQKTIIVTNNRSRNKPQSNATAAGGIIFISAGMNLALGLGWAQNTFFGGLLHFCFSWFLGVIIGTILAIPLRMFISKKYILGASALLIVVGGIIFTCVPFNYNAILTGRYLNGIGQGLATVTFLLLASEVAVDAKRGASVAIEQYSITMGLTLQMLYASFWNLGDFPVLRLHGILDIVFGVLAGIMLIFYIDSPIDQIRLGQEAEALETLSRLQRPNGVTIETHAWLEQCKSYVREHESMTFSTSMRLAMWPLIKMIFFRSAILVFCYSISLNILLQYSVVLTANTWVPTVAGCCRVLGSIITLIISDNLRRKVPSLFWMAGIGCLLIAIGSIFQDLLLAILDLSSMKAVLVIYIILQLCAGFFTPYTSILLAEAFPLRVKDLMMGVCVIVEQLLHIILINTLNENAGTALIVQGVIVLVTFVAMILCLPETQGTSLAEAQRRFRKPMYGKFN